MARRSSFPLVIHNRLPLAGWIFMAIWLSMLSLFTWLFAHDGGFHQFAPAIELAILGLFWLFDLGGGGYFLNMPVTRLSFSGGGASLREIRPWAVRDQSLTKQDLATLTVREGKDNDGDPYFTLQLRLPSGHWVTVREGSDRAALDALCRDLRHRA